MCTPGKPVRESDVLHYINGKISAGLVPGGGCPVCT